MTGRIPRLSPPSLLAFALVALARASAQSDDGRRVGTWAAAPQRTVPANMPPCARLGRRDFATGCARLAHAGVGATALA